MAMYERSRLSKWQTINDTRILLPKGDKLAARSQSAELFRTSTENFSSTHISWMPAERARTLQQMKNGKTEVLKATAKRLRGITAVGDFSEAESEAESAELKQKLIDAKHAAERKRKDMIKKDEEKERLRKERVKKERKAQQERQALQKEMDDNMTARLKALHDSWDTESKDKQRKLDEHMEAIKKNLAETDRKKVRSIHTHARVRACVHVHTHTHTYIHAHTHTHTEARTHTHTNIHTHAHTRTHTHTNVHTHAHTLSLSHTF